MNKKNLIDIVTQSNDIPFLQKLVSEALKRLPRAAVKGLAHELWLEYVYDGPRYHVTEIATGKLHVFTSYLEIIKFFEARDKRVTEAFLARMTNGSELHECIIDFYE